MTGRFRVASLAGIVVLALVGATVYVLGVRSRQRAAADSAPPVDTAADVATVSAGPHLAFRSTALGDTYGRVSLVPLDRPGGARAVTPASCERVYAVVRAAICLSADRGLMTTYRSQMLGADWKPAGDLPLTGLPSRARLSRDGSLAATTTFVYGDSYASPGQFSTRTLVSRTDGSASVDLEEFRLVIDGRTIDAVDRNLWGVTLVDNDRFYATAATGGRTWLVRGSLTERSLEAIRADVECPSLSPDGTRIAFKKHGDLPAGQWRLAVLDLSTGTETVLAETRSVDDQAEWLDDDRVIYGLPRAAAGSASSDIWVVPADGSGRPETLVRDAWSPAVVRAGG
jgi:hypothetical protein